MTRTKNPMVAIACGGTGGHLFPGVAVAEQLLQYSFDVTLLVSPKDVDQQAVKNVSNMSVMTLPAVGLQRGSKMAFLRGFHQSYRVARQAFKERKPCAVIAMGGFTSAPPVLAAKSCGARTFLHESNTIPGRANRWLSWLVNTAFVGFPTAAKRLNNGRIKVTGTPVRPCFQARDARDCKAALGLDPNQPVVLVVGGSQGASGLNDLVARSLPAFAKLSPAIQWFHLAGPNDVDNVRQSYASFGFKAVVHSFFPAMEVALAAADAAISRAGASSLAELAALRLPAILVPYPTATDNHQLHNALAFVETGAARLHEQNAANPEILARSILEIIENPVLRESMQTALAKWQSPRAAEDIAQGVMQELGLLPILRDAVLKNGMPAPSLQGGISL